MKAIGIDIGTTSICGILLDCTSGEILKSVTKNSDAFINTQNEWEKIQDTEKIISIALSITDELICDDTAVIGITGQMHGIVYFDEKGTAISPLYTWQDTRGNLRYKETQTYSEFLNLPAGYGSVTDFYNTAVFSYNYYIIKTCVITFINSKPLVIRAFINNTF